MSEAPEKAVKETAAPKKAAESPKAAKPNSPIGVKNISTRVINTSLGSIKPGSKGEATPAELRQLNKYIEKA